MGGKCDLRGEAPACTDNFQVIHTKFEHEGHMWYSVEQAYQASKFAVGSDKFNSILNAEYDDSMSDEQFGLICWAIGQNGEIREDWDEVKVRVMLLCNLSKFECHDLQADLLDTYPLQIYAKPSTWDWEKINTLIMRFIRYRLLDNYKTGNWEVQSIYDEVKDLSTLELIILLETCENAKKK